MAFQALTLFLALCLPVMAMANSDSEIGAMSEVHSRFSGQNGTFACFGDSITVTMAFWSPLPYADKNISFPQFVLNASNIVHQPLVMVYKVKGGIDASLD